MANPSGNKPTLSSLDNHSKAWTDISMTVSLGCAGMYFSNADSRLASYHIYLDFGRYLYGLTVRRISLRVE